jgi:hypothetical protein
MKKQIASLVLSFCLAPSLAVANQQRFDEAAFLKNLNAELQRHFNDAVTADHLGSFVPMDMPNSGTPPPPDDQVRQAVAVIQKASAYIAAQLCSQPLRPSKLTFTLTASFHLVVSSEAGTQVEWDLADLCSRYQQ